MAEFSVEYINPFLMAATSVIKDICQVDMKIGRPYVKTTEFASDSVIIMIGVTGEVRGQVYLKQSYSQNICVPLTSDEIHMELDIAINVN